MTQHKELYELMLKEVNKRGCSDASFFGSPEGPYKLLQNAEEFASLLTWMKMKYPHGIPRFLEIGTASGGGIRTIHELVGFQKALSIDLPNSMEEFNRHENLRHIPPEKYRYVGINSHSLSAFMALNAFGEIDVAFIDGDHFGAGVTQDIELCLGFMKKDSYMVFHDIESRFWTGVRSAVEQKVSESYLEPLHYFLDPKPRSPLGILICKVTSPQSWPSFRVYGESSWQFSEE